MPTIEVGDRDLVVVLLPRSGSGSGAPGFVTARVLIGDEPIGLLSRLTVDVDAAQRLPSVTARFVDGLDPTTAEHDTAIQERVNAHATRLMGTGFVTVFTPWQTFAWGYEIPPVRVVPDAEPEPRVPALPRYERVVFED